MASNLTNVPGTNMFVAATSTLRISQKNLDGYAVLAECDGTPPTTADTFAHGCLIIQKDTTTGTPAVFQNNGSVATPAWGIMAAGVVPFGGTPQTLSGAGAVNLTTTKTLIVTTGANALTLADGVEGQVKFLVMKTDGGAGTLTPTNLYNGTTITFDDVGDSAYLVFIDGQWVFMGGTATLA